MDRATIFVVELTKDNRSPSVGSIDRIIPSSIQTLSRTQFRLEPAP